MKPTLDQVMTSVNYLPWKKVGQHTGVSYFDLLNDLGVGVMEAEGVKEQLFVLEQKRKITLVCMDPPYNSHIIVIRPRNVSIQQTNAKDKDNKKNNGGRFR